MTIKELFSLGKQSFQEWLEDRAVNEAAALAYFTMLSVPAMLLLIQWLLGQVVSTQVQDQVIDLVQRSVQGQGSEAITAMIENADRPGSGGPLVTIVSLATLAVSATSVVVHLEQALNRIWEIAEEEKGIVDKIRERATSFLIVMALGLFLLISVAISSVVSAFAEDITGFLPMGEWALQLINIAVSLFLLTLLFATAFKVIPNADVSWSDMWLGAFVTAVLFQVGQFALSIYLGKSAPGSAYGAAGSIVAFLIWVYYSALIMFLGAEFTQVYANRYGMKIKPDTSAEPLREKIVEEQALPSREPADPATPVTMTPSGDDARPRRPAQFERGQRQTERSRLAYRQDVPAGARMDRDEEESSFSYYTVAFLALLIGVWRWLREE